MNLNWNFLNRNRRNQIHRNQIHRNRNPSPIHFRYRCPNRNPSHFRSHCLNRYPTHCRCLIRFQNQNHYLNLIRSHYQNRFQILNLSPIRYHCQTPNQILSRYHFPIPTPNLNSIRYCCHCQILTRCHFPNLNLSCWNCWILHRDSADTDRRSCYRSCRYTDNIRSENRRVCRPSTTDICRNTDSNLWLRPHRTGSSKPRSASRPFQWCLRSSESR